MKGQGIIRRFGYARNGIVTAFRRERSMRTHGAAAAAVAIFLALTGASTLWWALVGLAVGLVLVAGAWTLARRAARWLARGVRARCPECARALALIDQAMKQGPLTPEQQVFALMSRSQAHLQAGNVAGAVDDVTIVALEPPQPYPPGAALPTFRAEPPDRSHPT